MNISNVCQIIYRFHSINFNKHKRKERNFWIVVQWLFTFWIIFIISSSLGVVYENKENFFYFPYCYCLFNFIDINKFQFPKKKNAKKDVRYVWMVRNFLLELVNLRNDFILFYLFFCIQKNNLHNHRCSAVNALCHILWISFSFCWG